MSNSKKSYYEILGVQSDCQLSDIKRAYRKLAMEYHPDKNEDGAEKFKEISKAYTIISDPEKRQIYDQYGEAGPPQINPMAEMFEQFFNQGHPFHQQFQQQSQQEESHVPQIPILIQNVEVTLAELYHGITKKVSVTRINRCYPCDNSGSVSRKNVICPQCHGRKVVITIQEMGNMRIMGRKTCPGCRGSGNYVDPQLICHECQGKGGKEETLILDCHIPAGSRHHSVIEINEGHEGPNYRALLQFVLFELQDSLYHRVGANNLQVNLNLTYAELIVGFSRDISHPTGTLKYHYLGTSYPKDVFVVKDKGMPFQSDPSQHGDLIIMIGNIEPMEYTDIQRKEVWKSLQNEEFQLPETTLLNAPIRE